MAFPLSSQIFTNGNAATFSNTVSAGTLEGNGGQIANITGANVVGAVSTATVASTAYSVDAANVSGTVATATTAGTVTTAAQPNITSVGTLSTLAVSGNVSAAYYTGNGSQLGGVVATSDKPSNLLYVAKNGNDSTGSGSINAPYLTVQAAINAANAAAAATTIILAPGNYNESLTIANASAALNITGSGLSESSVTGNILISGSSNNIEFDNFRIATGRVTHSATGYWSVLNMRFSANTGITKTSSSTIKLFNTDIGAAGTGNLLLQAGKTNIYNSQVFNPIVSGATTEVNFLQCDTVILPTVTAGNVNFIDSIVVSAGTGNSLTATGGNVTLKNCLSITPTRALAPINFGASSTFSYGDSSFDYANTTFAGTAVIQPAQSQSINVRGGNIVSTANVTGGNLTTSGQVVSTGNISSSANIVATANVFGTYIIGNGSLLTNLTGANVTGEVALANTVSNPSQPNITALGTITSLSAGAATFSGQLTANGNAQFNGDAYFAGNVTIPGNINQISGNSGQFFGNVVTGFNALYAGLPAGYTLLSQEITQFAASYNGYTQTSLQNLNAGDQATGDYVITADNGTDFINHIDMGIAGSGYDGAIAVANNALGTSLYPNDGYLYTKGNVTGGNLVLGSNQANGVVRIIANGQSNIGNVVATFSASGLTVAGTVLGTQIGNSASYLYGDGSNITGTIANAAYSTNANSSTYANTAFSVAGANVTGTVATATTAGTVTTAAQPNITSVGTLSSLSVTGNVSAAFFTGNGSALTGIVSSYGNTNVATYLSTASTNGNIYANEVTAKQLSVPYANTNAYDANVIVLNGSTLYKSNSTIAANIPFAVGNTANTWSMVQQWTPTAQMYYVDPDNGLDTNDGSVVNPVKTVARAQVLLSNIFGVVNLFPGTYTENVTWTKQNTTIIGPGNGDMVNITGTWDFAHNGTSVRCQGLGFSNTVTHSGSGDLYFFQCSTQILNLTTDAFFEASNCNLADGNVSIGSTGNIQYVNINNSLFNDMVINGNSTVTINNSQANNCNVVVDLGTFIVYNSTMISEAIGNTVMTASNVSNVIINGSTFADSDGTSAIINIAGGYSFGGVNYDAANSVITGTSFGDFQYFDNISVINYLKAAALIQTRVVPRVDGVASGASITIDANAVDQYDIAALATGATINAPTGTLTDGQKLTIRIRDNGGAQTLTWNSIFRAIGTTLPTTTVAGKLVYVGCIYNVLDTKWDVVSVAQEA